MANTQVSATARPPVANSGLANARPLVATPGPLGLLSSSVGLKIVMAVTGAIMVGFLVGHFVGNALIWVGRDAINAYSAFLHNNQEILWSARVVLLLSVILHIVSAVKLTTTNMGARPQRYRVKKDVATNYAARTMVWSGPIILAFIFYHLAHLTFGVTPGPYAHSHDDVYANLVNGFSIPWVAAFYIVAMMGLGLHLFHGVWSMFQSLGINHTAYNDRIKGASFAIAFIITVGNISIPLSVLMGLVH